MQTTTVNISFQGSLLSEIDRLAQAESRSRSELLREAARLYIDRKRRGTNFLPTAKALSCEDNSQRRISRQKFTPIGSKRPQKR